MTFSYNTLTYAYTTLWWLSLFLYFSGLLSVFIRHEDKIIDIGICLFINILCLVSVNICIIIDHKRNDMLIKRLIDHFRGITL